jgi:hypothetical protein
MYVGYNSMPKDYVIQHDRRLSVVCISLEFGAALCYSYVRHTDRALSYHFYFYLHVHFVANSIQRPSCWRNIVAATWLFLFQRWVGLDVSRDRCPVPTSPTRPTSLDTSSRCQHRVISGLSHTCELLMPMYTGYYVIK